MTILLQCIGTEEKISPSQIPIFGWLIQINVARCVKAVPGVIGLQASKPQEGLITWQLSLWSFS